MRAVQFETFQPPTTTRLPTRTRQRAMDWSLVLASQGIEAVIEHEASGGWQLSVRTEDIDRARAAIAQYRRENLRWPWRQPVLQGRALFDWASGLWILLTAVCFGFNSAPNDLRPLGVVDSAAIANGEWWRLFTATVLHADILHFASNAVFGLMLLGLAMGRHGTGVGLLAAYLAGVAGNVFSWSWHGATHSGLGASGVVMGALGLLVPQSVVGLRGNPRAFRLAAGGVTAGIMLFLLLGIGRGTDVSAHFGGFLCGTCFGVGLALFPRLASRRWVDLFAGIIFALLVLWPWLLALRTHR